MEPGVIIGIIDNLKVDGSNPSRGTKQLKIELLRCKNDDNSLI